MVSVPPCRTVTVYVSWASMKRKIKWVGGCSDRTGSAESSARPCLGASRFCLPLSRGWEGSQPPRNGLVCLPSDITWVFCSPVLDVASGWLGCPSQAQYPAVPVMLAHLSSSPSYPRRTDPQTTTSKLRAVLSTPSPPRQEGAEGCKGALEAVSLCAGSAIVLSPRPRDFAKHFSS